MLITIKPIDKSRWHGLDSNTSITNDTSFTALIDSKSMQYAVDMTSEEIEEYGVKLNRDLSLHFKNGSPHEFWDSKTATVVLKDIPVVYETTTPLDFIKYRICRGSSIVANSLADYKNGLFPRATHYIYSEEEELETKTSRVKLKYSAIKSAMNSSRVLKDALCLLIGGRMTKGLSNDAVDITVDELIEAKTKEVVDFFKQSSEDKAFLLTNAMVEEALYHNVLRKKEGGIHYFETLLGINVVETSRFLMQDINQPLSLQIKKAIKN